MGLETFTLFVFPSDFVRCVNVCVCWFQSFCTAHCAFYVVRDNVTSIFIIIITIYKGQYPWWCLC